MLSDGWFGSLDELVAAAALAEVPDPFADLPPLRANTPLPAAELEAALAVSSPLRAWTLRDGTRLWELPGVGLHRTDGPAVDADGRREWFVAGARHRAGAPALWDRNGTRQWWHRGRLHRLDGPAVQRPDEAFELAACWARGSALLAGELCRLATVGVSRV